MEPLKQRIYAFDTIRTVMVLLGIVIHAAILYNANIFRVTPFYSDPSSQWVGFNVIGDLFRVFRMPVFFSVSGFFTALLFFERGVASMISNRLHRLVYPFIVALLVLLPMHVFSLNFFALSLVKLDNRYDLAWSAVRKMGADQMNTVHLWFLYYLILYCLTAVFLAYGFEKWSSTAAKSCSDLFARLFKARTAPLLLAIPTLISLFMLDTFVADAVHSFAPDFGFYLHYSVFFLFGWLCYGVKAELGRFENLFTIYLFIGLALFAARWYCLHRYYDPETLIETKAQLRLLLIVLFALTIWLFTFGTIGFFHKYFNKPSRISRYISDGSYWIYLIHMPIVIYFQSLLLAYDLPVFVKFSIVMLATVVVAVLSYHYLVRATFIGKFLNGRKYPREF